MRYGRDMAWLAVYSRPNSEETVANKLRSLAPVFYPFVRERKRVRTGKTSRLITVERAYFTRYLFVKNTDPWLVHNIKEVREVLAIVNVSNAPLEIPDRVVDALRSMADAEGCVEERDFTRPSDRLQVRVGDMVAIERPNGPLNGLIVKLSSIARLDSHNEVSVFVHMLGSEREVRVPAKFVSAAAAVG